MKLDMKIDHLDTPLNLFTSLDRLQKIKKIFLFHFLLYSFLKLFRISLFSRFFIVHVSFYLFFNSFS